MPAIDIRAGRVVRLARGRPEAETVYAEDPGQVAARFVDEGAEWLHVVDLDAALGTGENTDSVAKVIESSTAPVQVGGGLRSLDAVESVFGVGAARAVLGTRALEDPDFASQMAARFGDRILVAIDVDGDEVRTRGWTAGAGNVDAALVRLDRAGIGRFLVSAVGRDGLMAGPDLGLYRRVKSQTPAHVIASGGVRDTADVLALAAEDVEAVIVGTALYQGSLTVSKAKEAST